MVEKKRWQKENARHYITSERLAQQLHDGLEIQVVEVYDPVQPGPNGRSRADYLAGHIPGASLFDFTQFGPRPEYLPKLEVLQEVFEQQGIRYDQPVVFYGSSSVPGMHMAAKTAFVAYLLGMEQIYILDGGYQDWLDGGYDVESDEVAVTSVPWENPPETRQVAIVQTPEEYQAIRQKEPERLVVSFRSLKEYQGQSEQAAGEIKGAVYAGDESLFTETYHIQHPENFEDRWQEEGICLDRPLVIHCGSGFRASTGFFLLKELGYEDVILFDGSWAKYYPAHLQAPDQYPIKNG